MGCQKNIAKSIRDKGADYVLMVKGNQKETWGQVDKLVSITPVKSEFKLITKMALKLIDQEKSTKKSKPSKRLLAALEDDDRVKI